MAEISIPHDTGTLTGTVPDKNILQIVLSKPAAVSETEDDIIRNALAHPIESPTLREMARGKKKILIATSDHTRSMPSRLTLPAIIESIGGRTEEHDITILVGGGLHRGMTDEEMEERFGDLRRHHKILNHDARDKENLAYIDRLSSGNDLYLNSLVKESELVIGEGFIEPHFFAGFSGGRKCLLPGLAGEKTIIGNHSPQNIAHPRAALGVLEGNPIHEECLEAAKMGGLAFILNVMLDKDKRVFAAVAGDPEIAHLEGCRQVREAMSRPVQRADIVITSNSGYPLDRNLYQAVKGMDTAAKAAAAGGVIILVAGLRDGAGHGNFTEMLSAARTLEELEKKAFKSKYMHDRWQVQILARILKEHPVIIVSRNEAVKEDEIRAMHMTLCTALDEAVAKAFGIKGEDATVNILPEGPTLIPLPTD